MDDEQKPDPVQLGQIRRKEAKNDSNQSPSFSYWMNKGAASYTISEDQIGQNFTKNANNGSTNMLNSSLVPSFNNWRNKGSMSYTRSENQIPKNSTKNEPWSPSSNSRNLVSAPNIWMGMNEEPTKATFMRKSPELSCKTRTADKEQVRLLLKGNAIPTRPRSGLKRPAKYNKEYHPPKDNKIKKTEETLFCELCQISCSGTIAMQQHLSGRQHKAKMEYRKLKRGGTTNNGDRRGKPMCDVCQIWCSDRGALEMHYKGQKHKAKVKETRNNEGPKDKCTLVLCELCHVHCMNKDLYQMHLKGKQHAWEELKRKEMIGYTY